MLSHERGGTAATCRASAAGWTADETGSHRAESDCHATDNRDRERRSVHPSLLSPLILSRSATAGQRYRCLAIRSATAFSSAGCGTTPRSRLALSPSASRSRTTGNPRIPCWSASSLPFGSSRVAYCAPDLVHDGLHLFAVGTGVGGKEHQAGQLLASRGAGDGFQQKGERKHQKQRCRNRAAFFLHQLHRLVRRLRCHRPIAPSMESRMVSGACGPISRRISCPDAS